MSIHIDFILIRRAIATLVRRCLDQSRSLVITLSILFPSAALADNVYVTSDDCSAPPTTCALYIVGSSGTVTGSITVGDDPIGVALSPDGTYGYVANEGDNTIEGFPLPGGPVSWKTSVPSGSAPQYIAVTPNGSQLWVSNYYNSVSVLTGMGSLVTTISLSGRPGHIAFTNDGALAFITMGTHVLVYSTGTSPALQFTLTVPTNANGIAVTPNGKFAYVASQGPSTGNGAISIISIPANHTTSPSVLTTQIVGPTPFNPFESVAFSPDGSHVYFNDQINNKLYEASTATNTITRSMTTPGGAMSLSADGTSIYLEDGQQSISQVNANTFAVTSIPVVTYPGAYTFGLAASSTPPTIASTSYVPNQGSDTVSVINNTTRDLIATVTLPSGSAPTGVAVSPSLNEVYIADYGSGKISIINTSNNSVSTPISLGSGTEPFSIAFTPDGDYAYVTESGANAVAVIDTTTTPPSIATTISTNIGTEPVGVAITPDGSKAYVTNYLSASVSVINTATNTASTPITSGIGTLPAGIAISPDGANAYVANEYSDNVSKLPIGSTSASLISFPTGTHPFGVAVSPDSTRAYVTDNGTGEVSVITLGSSPSVSTPLAASYPLGIAMSPDGSEIYFANNNSSGSIGLANTATNTNLGTIGVGSNPQSLGLFVRRTPNPYVAYVANQSSNSVSVIDTTDDSTITTIALASGTNPTGTAISPDKTKVCVTELGAGKVGIITTATNTIPSGNTVSLGTNTEPFGVAFTPDSRYCYVTEFGSSGNKVVQIDTNASPPAVVATISTNIGTEPAGIAITPDGTLAYVSNYGSNSVSVITLATNSAATPITSGIGSLPLGIAISPDQSYVYIANQGSGSVSKLPVGGTSASTISIGTGTDPAGIAVTPDSSRAYVADNGTGEISIIALGSSPTVTTPIAANYPFGLSITPDGSRVYFANSGNSTLGVIDTVPRGRIPGRRPPDVPEALCLIHRLCEVPARSRSFARQGNTLEHGGHYQRCHRLVVFREHPAPDSEAPRNPHSTDRNILSEGWPRT
jgi:YVTN family beta-propeller protein